MTIRRALPALIAMCVAFCTAYAVKKAAYNPQIHASEFKSVVDNPYYPLVPGTVLKYAETDKGEVKEDTVTVTKDTKTVMGVPCVVVHDVVTKKGRVAEDTYDWLSQRDDGSVWYFGEDTKEYKKNGVDTEGSWEAGVGPNRPGIIMPGHPTPGKPFRQEYGPGHAEDMGQVIAVHETVAVPYGTFKECVRTKEWSLLEAGHEKKWYAKDIGVVRTESTSKEIVTLISVTHQ